MYDAEKIPKVIHYCWFGKKPLPKLARKCIASWKKYLPEYEIREWNEDNFDIDEIPYTRQAYKAKKYAFVSDYARFRILYQYGGVYFDTDVEVIKPMDELLAKGPFMGCEWDEKGVIDPGLGMAVAPRHPIYKEMVDRYAVLSFINEDGSYNQTTVVAYITDILKKHGLPDTQGIRRIKGITFYPKEYLCPKDYKTRKIQLTENTYSIHHYSASWIPWLWKLKYRIIYSLGEEKAKKVAGVKQKIKVLFGFCGQQDKKGKSKR